MPSRKKLEILFILQFILLSPTIINTTSQENTDTTQILFIGSSYFAYNSLTRIFRNFADEGGKEVSNGGIDPMGTYLYDHASSQSTTTKIKEKKWDYVVLQGIGVVTAYPDNFRNKPVNEALITLRETILLNNPSTKIIFCLPWAFEDGMTWKAGWNDTYEEMQQKVNNQTIKYSTEIGFTIAPVGIAWNSAIKEKGYPLHYLHLGDWNHPSLNGSYLMACVIYSTIFQENCTGNTYSDELGEEDAQFLQRVASETVMDNLNLWNLNGSIINSPNDGIQPLDQSSENSIRGNNLIYISIFSLIGISIIILQPRRHIK